MLSSNKRLKKKKEERREKNIHPFKQQCAHACILRQLCTHVLFQCLLHSGGHHDDTEDCDQQEVESVHESGPCGLFDLRAALTAARAGRWAAAAGQLHTGDNGEKAEETERWGRIYYYTFHNFSYRVFFFPASALDKNKLD